MVPVKINPEKSKAGQALAGKYGVSGYPTIVFLTPDGRKVHQIADYEPPDQFAADMQKALARAPR